MTRYGPYEAIEELHRGPLGHVVIARLTGDHTGVDQFVVKAFDAAPMGLLEADASTQTFLDRAALAKLLFDRGARHWAPIYEVRGISDGAYYVTDFYPLTVQKVIDAKVKISAADLHWLIGSVVRGLLELRSLRRRAHANLKATNVVIASRERIAGASIFLVDPGSSGKSADDRVGDMRSVGKLIHELVLGQPWRGEQDWPIADGPQWSRLGPQGARWREVCRQLLDPAARPEDLEALAAAVDALAPRPPTKRKYLLALAAAPVIVLLIVAGLIAHSNSVAAEQLAAVDRAWFSRFAKAMDDPGPQGRRMKYRADPDLKAVVDELEQADARHVPLDTPPPKGLQLTGGDQTREILKAIERIETDLSADHWKLLSDAVRLREGCAQRHWDQPRDYLADLLQKTQPAEGADVAAGIDRFLRVAPRVFADLESAETTWKTFDGDLQAATQSGDKTMLQFAGALRSAAIAPLRLDDDGLHGLAEVQADAPLATKLAAIARDGWPGGYGQERLVRDIEPRLNLTDPSPRDVSRWLDVVADYRLVPLDDASQAVAPLLQSFAKVRQDISHQELSADDRGRAAHAQKEVGDRIKALKSARYLSRDVKSNTGELASACMAVRRQIEDLRRQWVKQDDPAEWLAYVDQPLSVTSDKLKERWKQWIDAQRQRSAELGQNHEAFMAARKGADAIHAGLTALDQKFPQVPPGLSEKFAAAAWDKREQMLSELSQWTAPSVGTSPTTAPAIDAGPPPPSDAAMDAAAAQYGQWVENLRELNREFPVKRQLLTLEDRPDVKWRLKAPEFWNDPLVQTLVRLDVSRLGNLQNVADATREQLVGMASGSTVPEIAYSAWWRLGLSPEEHNTAAPAVLPPWPTRKGELDTELAVRARLDLMLKAVSAEAEAPLAHLKEQGPVRWRRYTETCDPELLPASARLFRSFGVDEAEVNKLSPGAHFDFFLYLAHVAAAGARDDQVTAAADNLRVSAGNLKDQAPIADLIVRLEHLSDRPPISDPALLEQKPGDVYKLVIKNSPYSIQFVRVAASGVRPFYLATTETSIGQFIDAVGTANSWPAANALLAPGRPLGPQAWAHAADPAQPIVRFSTWRFDDGRNPIAEFDFAPPLRQTRFNRHTIAIDLGGNPQEEHPMQQVPAQAALFAAGVLNCRLPSVREWQSAYDLFEAKTDVRQWNLRDQTFKMQLDYRPTDAPNQWPDNEVSGAYWPKDRPRPGQPNVHDTSDGTVFFRKVDAPGGSTLLNLVGNVAEFACDAPEAFDGLTDHRDGQAVARFAASMGAQNSGKPTAANSAARRCRLFVIGASALSDPSLDPIKPYPVFSASEPFADVGFRLAFSAPLASLSDRLKWAIDDQAYLPPPAVATTNISAR